MRIALLSTQFPGARLGGIGTYTLNAATALAGAGHDVHIFTLTLPPDVRSKTPAGVSVHEVTDLATDVASGVLPAAAMPAIQAGSGGGDGMFRLAVAWRFFAAVAAEHARKPFDVIEGPEYEALALPFILQPLSPPAAIVTQLHSGSAINRLGNAAAAAPGDALIDALEAGAILGADAVTAPTVAVMKATSQALLDGATIAASVIPLPLVPPAGAYSPPPENGPILYVGRIERLKGADLLGQAAVEVLGTCAEARVEVIGPDTPTGPGGTSMRQHVESMIPAGLAGRFAFLGEKNAEEVRQAMTRASIVVVPSRFENFSQVACEALAAGRAVVTASQTGPAEFVGDAGVLFESGDARALARVLIDLLKDRTQIETLARRAYERARSDLCLKSTLPRREAMYAAAVAAARAGTLAATADRLAPLPRRHGAALLAALAMMTGALVEAPIERPLTPGLRLLRIMERAGPDTPVLLCGAGRHTTRLLAERHVWESRGHQVVGLIDDHPRFADAPHALGLPVLSRAAIEKRLQDKQVLPLVVLSTDTFADQFWEQLAFARTMGLRVEKLYQ